MTDICLEMSFNRALELELTFYTEWGLIGWISDQILSLLLGEIELVGLAACKFWKILVLNYSNVSVWQWGGLCSSKNELNRAGECSYNKIVLVLDVSLWTWKKNIWKRIRGLDG